MGIKDRIISMAIRDTANQAYDAYQKWRAQRQAKKAAQALATTTTQQSGMTFNPQIIVQTGKEKDVMTVVMILAAYIIWIIDMANFLGKPYKGFIFDPSILTRINWIGVATSGIV